MQGGGHGPATHDFGLGADQVLEAQVVLASGKTIIANPCQYQDILFAIRGGGPSSYGIVVSTVIKAHPNNQVAAQVLSFAPRSQNDNSAFMDALSIVLQSYPDLSDGGFSGDGSWALHSPTPIFANYTTGFTHSIAAFGKSVEEAKANFAPTAAKLSTYNGSRLTVNMQYLSFPDFSTYYNALSDVVLPVGASAALGSRLLDRPALTSNPSLLNQTLHTLAGESEQFTSNNIVFVGGGQVARDASDPNSGVNPAWRTAYVHYIVARGWAPGSSNTTIRGVHDDITNVKVPALKSLAPNTGSYMNEGDRFDPKYLTDFYGSNLEKLMNIKRKYDPGDVFFCPTCIGSQYWRENDVGTLCPVDPVSSSSSSSSSVASSNSVLPPVVHANEQQNEGQESGWHNAGWGQGSVGSERWRGHGRWN